jgi:radical SAM superfamily enzyme YgiQ (UPF0313 family)
MGNKILLINTIPSALEGEKRESNIPPGLLAIGTWLTKNSKFEVRIIDPLIEENYTELIKKEIEKEDVFLVGISVMSSCVPNALEITRLIKKLNPKIKIIWGGIHCKLYPEQTVKHKLIDFVAYGEGEKPMLNLANCLIKKKSLSKVKGIAYKKGRKIIINPPEEFIDLNEIGIMNYKLLNPKIFEKKIIPIYTSRGCPHRCTFCVNVVTKNRKWRWLTAENVVKEMEYLIKNYGIEVLGFGDDCFFVNKERSRRIFDLILKKDIKVKLTAATRADYFTKGIIDQELLSKMKKCGFYNLGLGAEFGSQKMLDFIKKDISVKDILTSVKMLKKAGIGGTFAFMTGFPNETKEDTLTTVKLIKKMFKINPGITVIKEKGKIYEWREKVRIAGPQVYRPYPGGELYEYIVRKYRWHTPNTLEGWEKYFKENTRYKIEDYPWIKNPEYYAGLQFYVKSGKADIFTFLKRLTLPYPFKLKILTTFFYPFAKFRMLFNFFDFPFEYVVGKKLRFLTKLET